MAARPPHLVWILTPVFLALLIVVTAVMWNVASGPDAPPARPVPRESLRRIDGQIIEDSPEVVNPSLPLSSPSLVDTQGPRLESGELLDMVREMVLFYLDTTNLRLDLADIRGGAEIDDIPALTRPQRIPLDDLRGFPDDERVVVVSLGGEVVAYPLALLTWHEIVNDEVGSTPIAVIYCPLCDSATVVDRRVPDPASDGTDRERVLEFGVSGLLANSNIVMYDRASRTMWSQAMLEGISGRFAGTPLKTLPFELTSWGQLKSSRPGSHVVSFDTGYQRSYSTNPYERDLTTSQIRFPPRQFGRDLPSKTRGMGLLDAQGRAVFVTAEAIRAGRTRIELGGATVHLAAGPAGISATEVPAGIRAVQIFYYAWSAFHPETEVIAAANESGNNR